MRKSLIIIFFICFYCLPGVFAAETAVIDSLLNRLESVIADRDMYRAEKEHRIDELRRALPEAKDAHARFDILGNMFGEYHSYNTDSAYVLTLRQEELARESGDRNLLLNARLNRANILALTGMYHEALGLVDTLSSANLPDYLRAYCFHTKRTVYGYLGEYAAFAAEKEHYEKLTDQYRDSLLQENEPNSLFHTLIRADQLNVHDRQQEAIDLLTGYMARNNLSEHEQAIFAWTLSESYAKINDRQNQKKQVLISAISDMKSAVREYIALRQLALILYQEGDLDRAYRFLSIAVDDAAKCNARQRIVELNDTYPMINGIYVETITSQKKQLERTIIIITVLSVILVMLLFYMRKQMLNIADSRRKVQEANDKLNEANSQLSETNERLNCLNIRLRDSNAKLNELNSRLTASNASLQEAYSAIAEISELKEVYICRYMDQSLAYIEMLDAYRKSVAKLVASGKADDLKKFVKSSALVDDELKAFYEQFDKTFLNLFPSFVEDFNNLLLPEEAIKPKKEGTLTSELRIFALIRLGITDSDKIAKFLRYSLTTIYNYRTKVRNKAKGDRNTLEQEVMGIGRLASGN